MNKQIPRLSVALVAFVGLTALSGCAPPEAAPQEGASLRSSAADSAPIAEVVDIDAQERADSWLASVPVPPGAVANPSSPTSQLELVSYSWWCAPMAKATGYWTLQGAGVDDTANWLRSHPAPGLLVPGPTVLPVDSSSDFASVGNVPTPDSLEGIAFTVARTDDGVAIRAEVGAMSKTTTCATPPPGGRLGGPGEG